jgi:hypothetical protein
MNSLQLRTNIGYTRDGSGNPVYIGNGFANTYPSPSKLSLMIAWQPYPGLR